MDASIRAVLAGFEEATSKVDTLAKGFDKLSDSSRKIEPASRGAGAALAETARGADAANDATKGLNLSAVALGATLGTALVAAAGYMTKQFFDGIATTRDLGDQLNNLAQRTGFSVEALSGASLAARTAGLSLEQYSGALVQFNRHIDDATKGTGKSAEAFERLGISVRSNEGVLKSSDQLLREVSDKFAGMQDGAGKTALAVDLFGRSGAAMIPLLNEGSRGLATFADEAKRAGIVMSTETAEAAAKLNTNVAVLKSYGEGFWQQIAAPIVEGLARITTAMRDARLEGGLLHTVLAGLRKGAQIAVGVGSEVQERENVIAQITRRERDLAGARARGDEGQARQLETEIAYFRAERDRLNGTLAIGFGARDLGEFGMSSGKQPAPPRPTSSGQEGGGRANDRAAVREAELQARAIVQVEQMAADDAAEAWSLWYKQQQRMDAEALQNHMNLLRRREEADRATEEAVTREYAKSVRAQFEMRATAIERDATATNEQKAERLRALQDELERSYGFLREASEARRDLEKRTNRAMVDEANETARRMKEIFGTQSSFAVSALQGMHAGLTQVFREILNGHISLTAQLGTIWSRFVDGALNYIARSMSEAVLRPIVKPFEKVFEDLGEFIKKQVFDPAWEFIKSGFTALVQWLRNVDWGSALSTLTSALGSIGSALGGGDGESLLQTGLRAAANWILPGSGSFLDDIPIVSDVFDWFSASGTDTIVTRPTVIGAGEGGIAERVTISPLTGAARHGVGGERPIVFQGINMIDEYSMRRFARMIVEAAR